MQTYSFQDDGRIPNNPDFPLLVYTGVLEEEHRSASGCRTLFAENGWPRNWVNGVYTYHHYHSTAHEVLGVISGQARIQFGGPQGETLTVESGDVVVIPAGVGHCNQGSSGDFRVVGGYAGGRQWDMNTGKPEERPDVLKNIKGVPVPDADPVHGPAGPLLERWGN